MKDKMIAELARARVECCDSIVFRVIEEFVNKYLNDELTLSSRTRYPSLKKVSFETVDNDAYEIAFLTISSKNLDYNILFYSSQHREFVIYENSHLCNVLEFVYRLSKE